MTIGDYHTEDLIKRPRIDARAENVRRTIAVLENKRAIPKLNGNVDETVLYHELLNLADTSYLQGENAVLKRDFKTRFYDGFRIACVMMLVMLWLAMIVQHFME